MNSNSSQFETNCPSAEISSYIDGELTPARELQMEKHFAVCESCTAELNRQKKFLIALDQALESEQEVPLPANFTRVVVTNAESRVSGLRRPSERFNALFVCSGLFLFIVFALGADSNAALGVFFTVLEKIAAVGGFVVHTAYDIVVGAIVVLRCLASHFMTGSYLTLLFPGVVALYIYVVSRLAVLISRG